MNYCASAGHKLSSENGFTLVSIFVYLSFALDLGYMSAQMFINPFTFGLGNRTVRSHSTCLRPFFTFLKKARDLPESPAHWTSMVKEH